MRLAYPTPTELRHRRERLLDKAGFSREELQRCAEEGTLTPEEYWIWQDIRSVEFLLGDESADALVEHG